MISREIVEQMDPAMRREVKVALGMLHLTGVLDLQTESLKQNLLIGSDEESPEVLAAQILDMRKRVNMLSELHDVCEAYHKEMKNA